VRSFTDFNSLVYSTSNSKKFSLSQSNIDSMMDSFLDPIGERVNMWDRYGDIISNACIRNNNNRIGIWKCVCKDVIKLTKMSLLTFLIFVVSSIEKKLQGKLSINLKFIYNLWLRESKDGSILLRQLLVSTIELLILSLCFMVTFSNERQCEGRWLVCLLSSKVLIIWFDSKDVVLIWCLLLIFWRCRWMGIRPAIALTFYVGNVWKVPVISFFAFS